MGSEERVALKDAATFLLDECRMVLPGIQALFGFQLIAVFSERFASELTPALQRVHFVAIALVVVAIAIIMTPAALHREIGVEHVSRGFIDLSTRLLAASMGPARARAGCTRRSIAGKSFRGTRSVKMDLITMPIDSAAASVLIVDDDPASLMAMQEVLQSLGARLVPARSGEEALRKLLEEDFAAILLDVHMPGIDGFTTAQLIRERKRSRYTPIIFLTAAAPEDVSTMFRGYQAGAVDYMVKPVIPQILRSKLSVFVGLHDMNRMLNAELAERSLTEQRLRSSEENLRALAAHLQSVREEERTHIARDIHDELGQALTGLKLDITQLTRVVMQEDQEELQERTRALCGAIDRIIVSVRRIASGLRPEVLDEIGLAAAVEWQAREFQRRTGIRCHVDISHGFADPDTERATALFRIFQELLTNVARHANATRVNAKLTDAPQLVLVIEDNGRGIRADEFQSPRALGFLGMRERVQPFGGSIDVKGSEGKGTKVTVAIPLLIQQQVFHA